MKLKIKDETIFIDKRDLPLYKSKKWFIGVRESGIKYLSTSINGIEIYFHKLITNVKEGLEVDHINGNGLDNRRQNIRTCTHSQNMMNKKIYKNNRSGYKGVYRDKGKWRVQLKRGGKRLYDGYFEDPKEAAIAYNTNAVIHFGEFARLNAIS